MCEMREVFYFWDKIASNVKSGELSLTDTTINQPPTRTKTAGATHIMFKILQAFYTIVAEIQFLQTFECFEILNLSNPVRLQREDFETPQSTKILEASASINVTVLGATRHLKLRNLIFAEPELL